MSARRRELDPIAEALAYTTPARFAEAFFRFQPYPYQEDVMDAVLVRGKRRIAWVAGRRVGKTATTANIALQLAVRKPGTQVAIFAPSFKQACILSREVKSQLRGSRFEKHVVVDKRDELRLRFGEDEWGKPRESVIFTNSLSGKVRGEGADVLIIDESAFCKGEDYRSKALPFIADRPHAIVIHISTVWADDDHFMEAYREYPTQPNGAVFRTPTRLKPGVTEEFLADMRRSMTDTEFRREFEAELVPENGVFDRGLVAACLRDVPLKGITDLPTWAPKRHHKYYVGVDWGKKQDRAVIAVVEQGTQDKANPARLVFLQVYEPDPDNPHHYTRVLDDVKRVANHLKAERVLADEGEGAHQAEKLQDALGKRFRSFRFTRGSRDELVDNARLLVERRALELPMEPDAVRKAFAGVHRTDKGYAHASRQGKDVFDAIALALRDVDDATSGEARKPLRLASASPGGRAFGLRMGRAYDASKRPRAEPDGLSPELRRYLEAERSRQRTE